HFDSGLKVLSFGPELVQVLNVGGTEAAVVVVGSHDGVQIASRPQPTSSIPTPIRNGDSHFIQNLPRELLDLGVSLLKGFRRQFPGSLVFHPRSAKYVESPDNFWTVRIQPRARSLRITVRGTPPSFSKVTSVQLKPDMGTYSSFTMSSDRQIEEALRVIRDAA